MSNPSTPIARSKTAALSRVQDAVPKGYHRYIAGTVVPAKAAALAGKLHRLYGIGCTPAQRITRKRHGEANALLAMFWPEGAERVDWLMVATDGTGMEAEKLRNVEDKPRLVWLGYELVRHPTRGTTSWSWRRQKMEMAELYHLLDELLAQRYHGAVAQTLERIARQPGFHGVRTQSWDLCQYARQKGYDGELPHIFYTQKVSHGDRLALMP
jgi:hypothetical protein